MREQTGQNERTETSRAAWIDAAYELLINSGIDAVKVMPLAKKMGTSRTSFYWLFKDRNDVLRALLERWERNTEAVVRQSECYAQTPVEAMLNIFDCWFDPTLFDSEFEYAVRSWGLQDREVADRIQEADAIRLKAIREMFMRYGVEEKEAETRALTVYLIQIGYISMRIREPGGVRLQRVPKYIEIFTGNACKEADLDRFAHRHRNLFSEADLRAAKAGINNGTQSDGGDSGG